MITSLMRKQSATLVTGHKSVIMCSWGAKGHVYTNTFWPEICLHQFFSLFPSFEVFLCLTLFSIYSAISLFIFLNFSVLICLEFVWDTLFALVAVQNKKWILFSGWSASPLFVPCPLFLLFPILTLFGQLVCCHTQFVRLCVCLPLYLSSCLQREKMYLFSCVCFYCLVRRFAAALVETKPERGAVSFSKCSHLLLYMEFHWEESVSE